MIMDFLTEIEYDVEIKHDPNGSYVRIAAIWNTQSLSWVGCSPWSGYIFVDEQTTIHECAYPQKYFRNLCLQANADLILVLSACPTGE
jgi:hypothetical protein